MHVLPTSTFITDDDSHAAYMITLINGWRRPVIHMDRDVLTNLENSMIIDDYW